MSQQQDTTSAHQAGPSAAARTGSPDEWQAARLALPDREKGLNRLRDEIAAERRRLPWVRLDKQYRFDGPDGRVPPVRMKNLTVTVLSPSARG